MSAAIDEAVANLRSRKATLVAAEAEGSRLFTEYQAASEAVALATELFNEARVVLADTALIPE